MRNIPNQEPYISAPAPVVEQTPQYSDIREFDQFLETLQPHQRAGFIDSFYAQNEQNNDPYYLLELTALLEKWSPKLNRADFTPHAENTRSLAMLPASKNVTPELGSVMVDTRRKFRDCFRQSGLRNVLKKQ